MQHIPSWEADSHSASQEIPRLLWNPKVHFRVHNSALLVPILSHMNSIHILMLYLRSILILSSPQSLGLSSSFPSRILYTSLSLSPPHAYVVTGALVLNVCTVQTTWLWGGGVCISPCFITKTTYRISVKFGIRDTYRNLSREFDLDPYRGHITSTFHELKNQNLLVSY
jgi:hypothetical protein